MTTTNKIRDILEVIEDKENGLVFEKNVSIPLKASDLPTNCSRRCQIPCPCDIWTLWKRHSLNFFAKSFSEVNPEHKSEYSAWETPDPVFWTSKGYVVVRADERGLGQSPGLLDTMSRGTSECFFDVVEWASEQPWSSGKVGLLGISYYAGSQWRVAARRPKGLAAIIPWEGMTDYYRDRCRHGGILSDEFIRFWWNRQVITNQYGRPGRAASKWGEDTIEGDLDEETLLKNRNDQTIDNVNNRFLDDDYYKSKDFNLEDIEVPVLSVANWGGILLHLRGNVNGYMWAGSKFKYLRFITGRHDLPFYYKKEVEIQKSFLDADPSASSADKVSYDALGTLKNPKLVQFTSAPFEQETEITGHITAHLNVSLSPSPSATAPEKDIDIFLTIRHISPSGEEIFYTGTAGDPVPLTKGWLRVSLRKIAETHPRNLPYQPYREYRSVDVQEVKPETSYAVDVEVWPTNVVVEKGGKIVLEVSSGDTQGSGIFAHGNEKDRQVSCKNNIHFGEGQENFVTLPIVPSRS
ncbi:hypothetical protein EAE99_007062 [Botrytis elliptica]|nr:hypothetical protein EAE99_007062 [Botrytis elliptica]